eukprot:scaffold8049_cov286-Pinguiococcus_pyrenoidosus.AAC.7
MPLLQEEHSRYKNCWRKAFMRSDLSIGISLPKLKANLTVLLAHPGAVVIEEHHGIRLRLNQLQIVSAPAMQRVRLAQANTSTFVLQR